MPRPRPLLACLAALCACGPTPGEAHRLAVGSAGMSNSSRAVGEIYMAWQVVGYTFDVYQALKTFGGMYKSYVQRSSAAREIAEGHTAQTAALVRAAYQELGEQGRAEHVQEALQSDTFLQFRAMLGTFRQAHKMCIEEEKLSYQPSRWFFRKRARLSPEQSEALERSKEVIQSIVDSMQGVIDYAVCPQLAKEIKRDLAIAQDNVEAWERMTTFGGSAKGWSWYEMQFAAKATLPRLTALAAKLQDAVQKVGSKATLVDLKTCYFQPEFEHRRATPHGIDGVDEYEVSVNDSAIESMRDLWKFANEAEQALDRASLNLEEYDRECQGVEPKGKDGLLSEISAEAASGDERARKQLMAGSCDICIRLGCREVSLWEVLEVGFAFYRYGLDTILVASAEHLLPSWAADIVNTVYNAENILHPAGDKAGEFFMSLIYWLWFAKENVGARDMCMSMGVHLENHTLPALEELLAGVAGGAAPPPLAAPST